MTYDSHGFLEKNRDNVPGGMVELLQTSSNPLIGLVFTGELYIGDRCIIMILAQPADCTPVDHASSVCNFFVTDLICSLLRGAITTCMPTHGLQILLQ